MSSTSAAGLRTTLAFCPWLLGLSAGNFSASESSSFGSACLVGRGKHLPRLVDEEVEGEQEPDDETDVGHGEKQKLS